MSQAISSQPTTEIWSAFHERLRAFLRRRVQPEDVDDILQDVFVRIHRSLEGGEVLRDPTAWVHRVARTAVIDHYRRRGADRSEPHATPPEVSPVRIAEPLDDAARSELGRCVRPLIERLSPTYRDALVWTALDGLSQVEAADRAGISVSGMKSRVQRGRKKLAEGLLRCCRVAFDARGKPIDVAGDCSRC